MRVLKLSTIYPYVFLALFFINCKNSNKEKSIDTPKKESIQEILIDKPNNIKIPAGMVWVKGKTFIQGAKEGDEYAMHREKPSHQVSVDGFFMDITEVTNKKFKAFVEAEKYITVAEREIDWEEIKTQLPAGTPKPHDSILQPGSLVFNKKINKIASMENYTQWWTWKIGANWRHPEGPNSTIEGKEDYPVVHISYEDAIAYCKWSNRRLPTESEWESAAQGTLNNNIYTWGNTPELLNDNANTWQGVFPIKNESVDGFALIAPVKSYPSNSIGIYDMLGNVWEITGDWFNVDYYKNLDVTKVLKNPKGADKAYSPSNPYEQEYIIKGGSFLCHASYCASFRISAKMGMSPDSGSDHTGFRTIATIKMLE